MPAYFLLVLLVSELVFFVVIVIIFATLVELSSDKYVPSARVQPLGSGSRPSANATS